jgi:hypothetical protein
MTKEFVPYELAVKLKQLGFDEPCFLYWWKNESGYILADIIYDEVRTLDFKAPLFQQAFRWFREKEFLIDVTSLNSNEYEFYIQWSFAYSVLSDIYKSYEEAELACLEKLIEIVEGIEPQK